MSRSELTDRASVLLTRDKHRWREKNPTKSKGEWERWNEIRHLRDNCPLCERAVRDRCRECSRCLIEWPGLRSRDTVYPCCNSWFGLSVITDDRDFESFCHKKIADLCQEWLDAHPEEKRLEDMSFSELHSELIKLGWKYSGSEWGIAIKARRKAIEIAGWETWRTILESYGPGFPKYDCGSFSWLFLLATPRDELIVAIRTVQKHREKSK